MTAIRAHVYDTPEFFVKQTVRIVVWDRETKRLLNSEGEWVPGQTDGPAETDGPVGITIPRSAIEAIAHAIAEWQGHVNHGDTEARVLREWLAVEQRRVDRALERP